MSQGTDLQNADPQKLPLWDTICFSYSTFSRHFIEVLRISWLWLTAAAPLIGYVSYVRFSELADLMAGIKRGQPAPLPPMPSMLTAQGILLGLVPTLILLLAGFSIAVAWHRLLILGERPSLSGSNVAKSNMWQYIAVAIAVVVLACLPVLLILLPFAFWFSIFELRSWRTHASTQPLVCHRYVVQPSGLCDNATVELATSSPRRGE